MKFKKPIIEIIDLENSDIILCSTPLERLNKIDSLSGIEGNNEEI